LHDWVRVRRQLIVAVAVGVAGALMVLTGMSA
jgi:hypothetical protein